MKPLFFRRLANLRALKGLVERNLSVMKKEIYTAGVKARIITVRCWVAHARDAALHLASLTTERKATKCNRQGSLGPF